MKLLILTLSIFPLFAFADDGKEEQESKNYCHSQENKQQFDQMLSEYPKDQGVVKLYALRVGLCGMIDKGQIDLDTGIDIWELERSKITIERTNDELSESPKLVL